MINEVIFARRKVVAVLRCGSMSTKPLTRKLFAIMKLFKSHSATLYFAGFSLTSQPTFHLFHLFAFSFMIAKHKNCDLDDEWLRYFRG